MIKTYVHRRDRQKRREYISTPRVGARRCLAPTPPPQYRAWTQLTISLAVSVPNDSKFGGYAEFNRPSFVPDSQPRMNMHSIEKTPSCHSDERSEEESNVKAKISHSVRNDSEQCGLNPNLPHPTPTYPPTSAINIGLMTAIQRP